jgi:putative ABC transport system permease protein
MSWWLRLRRRRTLEHDLHEEIAFHREMRAKDDGAPPFGNETIIRESMHDLWTFSWIETTLQDVAYTFRSFRKSPGFAMTAILSLGLGIGAVLAIFTAADHVLFRPLPYLDAERLVMMWESNRTQPESVRSGVSSDNLLQWRARSHVFAGIAAYYEGRTVLYDGEHSEELHLQGVTGNFFALLGVNAFRGRLFPIADQTSLNGEELVISYRLWQRWFGTSPAAVGKKVFLDARPWTIVGVVPPNFAFGNRDVDIWLPLTLRPSTSTRKAGRDLNAFGRLNRHIQLAQAQAEMRDIASSLEREDPQFERNWTVTLEPLFEAFARNVKTSMLVLLAAVILLLAVACANVANLLFARYAYRSPEVALRFALGAGRGRLVRQFLTESLVLTMCAALVGIALGRYLLAGLIAIAPQPLTQAADLSIDSRILLFALGLSAATGILFGVVPAIISSRDVIAPELKRNGWDGLDGNSSRRGWLIACEVAGAVILVAGASLLSQSVFRLQRANSGLNPADVLTFHFRVPRPQDVSLFARAIEQIEKLPSVRSVSATSSLPFDSPTMVTRVEIAGPLSVQQDEHPVTLVRTITPRYFESLGIPIRQGRDFTTSDNTGNAPMRFVVNEAFASTYFSGMDPLRRSIRVLVGKQNPFGEIIGVVGDVREGSLRNRPMPTVFNVYAHSPYGQMTLAVRTQGNPTAILASVRRIVRDLDPGVAVADIRTMEAVLGETYARERFSAILMTAFSIFALLLAGIGIYGVLAYSVSRRTVEIGIRMALGAAPRRVILMVLSDGARFVIVGLIAGLSVALLLSRYASSLLFETSSRSAFVFTITPAILLIVAVLAAYIPARHAAQLDPVRALRLE